MSYDLRGNRVLLQELDNESVTGDISLSKVADIILPDSIAQDKGTHMQATIIGLGDEINDKQLEVGLRVIYERWKTRALKDGQRICYEEALIAILPQQEK